MAKKYHFTDEMLKELKELYPNTLTEELAERYNCSLSAIYHRAYKLGIKKSKEFVAEISREHSSRPDHGGKKTRFKKGTVPPNKGRRMHEYMSREAIERTKATRFKKGHIPKNHKPIGHERVTVDGYVEVKVRDQSSKENFELKHRLVWEEHNGPIPEGYNIQFKDGDRQNCKIDNLYMISRSDQICDNTIHRYPSELRKAIRLTGRLNNQINNYEQTNKY